MRGIMKNVLLIDDEAVFFEMLTDTQIPDIKFHYLNHPETATKVIEEQKIDLILMDWNLNEECGIKHLKTLKNHPKYNKVPIIMLTAKGLDVEIVTALNAGANDYITKPFKFPVLVARIHAQLRKDKTMFPIKLYEDTFEIQINDKNKISLRKKEFVIFKTLLESPDKTFSREYLNDITSGIEVHVGDRSIDTFVRMLRKTLEDNQVSPDLIQTIRGKGYKFNEEVQLEAL